MRDRTISAIAVAAGALTFGAVGTTPHLLLAFGGVRPFWSRFEFALIALLDLHLRGMRHSIASAVAFLVVMWIVIGAIATVCIRLIPPVRRRPAGQQVLLAVLTPCVVLPLLAWVAPFEPGF